MKPCGHADDVPDCGRCKLYRENPRVRAAWESRGGAVSERSAIAKGEVVRRALEMLEFPCPHRGAEPIDTVQCRTCTGTKTATVYACSIYGRCYKGSHRQDVGAKYCGHCKDRPR